MIYPINDTSLIEKSHLENLDLFSHNVFSTSLKYLVRQIHYKRIQIVAEYPVRQIHKCHRAGGISGSSSENTCGKYLATGILSSSLRVPFGLSSKYSSVATGIWYTKISSKLCWVGCVLGGMSNGKASLDNVTCRWAQSMRMKFLVSQSMPKMTSYMDVSRTRRSDGI